MEASALLAGALTLLYGDAMGEKKQLLKLMRYLERSRRQNQKRGDKVYKDFGSCGLWLWCEGEHFAYGQLIKRINRMLKS